MDQMLAGDVATVAEWRAARVEYPASVIAAGTRFYHRVLTSRTMFDSAHAGWITYLDLASAREACQGEAPDGGRR